MKESKLAFYIRMARAVERDDPYLFTNWTNEELVQLAEVSSQHGFHVAAKEANAELVKRVEQNLGLEPLNPSDCVLDYWLENVEFANAQSDAIAEQFDIPAGAKLPMEDVASILALPEGQYLMRMCMYVDGKDFEGEWQPKDSTVLGYTVKLAARKGIGFSVQFKEA